MFGQAVCGNLLSSGFVNKNGSSSTANPNRCNAHEIITSKRFATQPRRCSLGWQKCRLNLHVYVYKLLQQHYATDYEVARAALLASTAIFICNVMCWEFHFGWHCLLLSDCEAKRSPPPTTTQTQSDQHHNPFRNAPSPQRGFTTSSIEPLVFFENTCASFVGTTYCSSQGFRQMFCVGFMRRLMQGLCFQLLTR